MAVSARSPDDRPILAEDAPLPPEDRVSPALCNPHADRRLESLYREHGPWLRRFLSRRTRHDDAGDLVQQVFTRMAALGTGHQMRITNPIAYLRRSAKNLVADEAKLAARRSSSLHVSTQDVELRGNDQIAALEARDMLSRIEAAMLRLKPRTREIFLAHRIDGLSYVEIAARTGMTVKGVEKQMSKAIAHLDRVLTAR